MKVSPAGPRMDEHHADVAQLVEHHLAKVGVAGSNPVVRSDTVVRSRETAAFGRPFECGE